MEKDENIKMRSQKDTEKQIRLFTLDLKHTLDQVPHDQCAKSLFEWSCHEQIVPSAHFQGHNMETARVH